MKPCVSCGAAWYAKHFSWCAFEEKRCECGVMHCEESELCPICQLEAERERIKQGASAVNHQGGVA